MARLTCGGIGDLSGVVGRDERRVPGRGDRVLGPAGLAADQLTIATTRGGRLELRRAGQLVFSLRVVLDVVVRRADAPERRRLERERTS